MPFSFLFTLDCWQNKGPVTTFTFHSTVGFEVQGLGLFWALGLWPGVLGGVRRTSLSNLSISVGVLNRGKLDVLGLRARRC